MKKFFLVVLFIVGCDTKDSFNKTSDRVVNVHDVQQLASQYGVSVHVENEELDSLSFEEVDAFCRCLASLQNMHCELMLDSLNKVKGKFRNSERKEDIFANMEREEGGWSDAMLLGVEATDGEFTASVTWTYDHNKYFECWNPSATAEGSYRLFTNPFHWTSEVSTTKCVFGNWVVDFEFEIELRDKKYNLKGIAKIGGYCDIKSGNGEIG